MILSRILFNPLHRETWQLVSHPYELHRQLCGCVSARRADANLLFRLEAGPSLIVQSDVMPDWSKLKIPESALRCPPESKPFEPSFAVGQRLAFRLACRPSRKEDVPGVKNSRQRYLRTDEERLAWLARKGERHGFAVESATVVQERWRDTKHSQSADPGRRRRADSFPATRFDGVLVVTDPDKLREAVRKGIGPQKAYGFGLLSLARLQE